jgi:hypothetical protein
MATMSILGFNEFAAAPSSPDSISPMSTSSRPGFGNPRLQGEGGFSFLIEVDDASALCKDNPRRNTL